MADTPEKKVVVLSPAGSKVRASDITRQVPAVSENAISDPMKRETETGSFLKLTDTNKFKKLEPESDNNQAKRTIKLKPLQPKSPPASEQKTLDTPIPADAFKSADSQSQEALPDDEDATVKIDKIPRILKPSETNIGIPGAKQTIKLRPSSGSETSPSAEAPKPSSPSTLKLKPVSPSPISTPVPNSPEEELGPSEEQTISMQKKTIKLTPTRPSDPVAPSAPTIKLQEEATVQPPRPSSPTVKFTEQPQQAPAPLSPPQHPPQEAVHSGATVKKTLMLKKHSTAGAEAPASPPSPTPGISGESSIIGEGTEPGQQKSAVAAGGLDGISKKPSSDEPNIFFTIAAGLTFLALAYFAWMTIGQFGEEYLGWQTANVPGLSGTVK